ncbi:MAG: malonic semialdehyde reductase [Alphaproteobacteria bacterium]
MGPEIDAAALDQIFLSARTRNRWSDLPVSNETLRRLYDILKFGPTTSNSLPGRFLFLTSLAAKKRIEAALDEGNRAKSMQAPVLTVIAYDLRFYEYLAETFPHNREARSWFEGKPDIDRTALRNGTLQGAYLILAARALGLDCGPMSGFNEDMVNRAFFPDGRWRANFLCALGHASDTVFPRLPRLPFDTACRIL